jgi:membrane-associated HD superfamily phosphohydrolase
MHIKLVMPMMVLALSPVFASPQTSTTVKLVTLGQLDGPRLRQLAPYMCGP